MSQEKPNPQNDPSGTRVSPPAASDQCTKRNPNLPAVDRESVAAGEDTRAPAALLERDDETAHLDDTVIGRAFRWSLAGLALICVVLAGTVVYARRKPAPLTPKLTILSAPAAPVASFESRSSLRKKLVSAGIV